MGRHKEEGKKMIMFADGGYRILPHEMGQIKKAMEIEEHLLQGCIIYYEELEEIGDMYWHDILRRHDIEEVPGEGYRLVE